MNQFPLSSKQKVPFVCFSCRASKKVRLPFTMGPLTSPLCPNCEKPMIYLGRYFKIPPQSAREQWRKAELLWKNGWVASGYLEGPQSLRDAREWVQKKGARATSQRDSRSRAASEERWRRLRKKREQHRYQEPV